MVYVVQSYWAYFGLYVFFFPHTRLWIESKTSPIALEILLLVINVSYTIFSLTRKLTMMAL
jgi:hypothetical protein